MSHTLALFLAQVTNAASDTAATTPDASAAMPQQPWWVMPAYIALFVAILYFAFFRPQMQASKKRDDTIKTAKTGDKIVTSSGIHGVITNVKDSTVIVKVADNVKLEIEKTHIDKITRESDTEKVVTAKA